MDAGEEAECCELGEAARHGCEGEQGWEGEPLARGESGMKLVSAPGGRGRARSKGRGRKGSRGRGRK